jgi:type III restriction enzyme
MRLKLREYQEVAVVKLLKILQQAQYGARALCLPQGIQFSAPTGAGKTVMLGAIIEALLVGNEYSAAAGVVPAPDLTFLWLSDLPELNRQSLVRIQDVANGIALDQLVEIDASFDRSELETGRAYFLNYQKLRAGSLLTRPGDDRSSTIWETIAATQAARPGKLIAVIDEAHRGLGNARTAQTIASKFVLGAQGDLPDPMIRRGGASVQFPALDIVLGMSATPARFQSYLTNQGGRAIAPVDIHPAEVRGSGLIKDQLILHGCRDGEAPWSLLGRATQRVRDFERDWRRYCDENQLETVQPALLVQVEDGAGREISATDLPLLLEMLRNAWSELTGPEVAHCFHGTGDLDFGNGWVIPYREPSAISADTSIRVVLFKTALNTGWDCPRAEVLMSFRTMRDRTAIAQLVGRMVRTPLGRSVPGDAVLNSTHLFLPFFERGNLEQVRSELLADLGEAGTTIEAAADIQELVLRPGGEALFDVLKIAPTEVVPSSRPTPVIRRLLRTTRLLEQHGLADRVTAQQIDGLMQVLRDAFAVRQNQKDFLDRVRRRGEYVLSRVTVQDGLIIAEADEGGELAASDVETGFQAAAALVAEEIANRWLRERYDPDAPVRAKLEFLELVGIPAVLAELQQVASAKLAEIEACYRSQILALPPAQADQFAVLQRSGRSVQLALMMPERRVMFPLESHARQYDGHLFVVPDTDDKCLLQLNSWEDETLEEERRRPDFLGFLRNLDRKRWALSYAYEYDGVKAGFPDLLVFRAGEDGTVLDVLEPHLDAGDSVAKAKGLARFARDHRSRIGRVEMLRKLTANGLLVRLRLDDPVIAGLVLDKVTSNEQLVQLFKDQGTHSQY